MTPRTIRRPAPAAWASALLNADWSGLDPAEAARCRALLRDWQRNGWEPVDCGEESYFSAAYDLHAGPEADPLITGGDLADYVLVRR